MLFPILSFLLIDRRSGSGTTHTLAFWRLIGRRLLAGVLELINVCSRSCAHRADPSVIRLRDVLELCYKFASPTHVVVVVVLTSNVQFPHLAVIALRIGQRATTGQRTAHTQNAK